MTVHNSCFSEIKGRLAEGTMWLFVKHEERAPSILVTPPSLYFKNMMSRHDKVTSALPRYCNVIHTTCNIMRYGLAWGRREN